MLFIFKSLIYDQDVLRLFIIIGLDFPSMRVPLRLTHSSGFGYDTLQKTLRPFAKPQPITFS